MRYKVISAFADLLDSNYIYNVGDEFPRQGIVPSKDRIAELSSSDNKQGRPLIEKVPKKK